MEKISSYAKEMTEDHPTPPKGFTETKDHYTGWFFKSLKKITSEKP